MGIYHEFISQFDLVIQLIFSHLFLTVVAVAIASFIGLTIGILISEKKVLAQIIISIVNVLYTVPSIALLGLFISITGIGNTTALIALIIYALLPMVRSTYVGLNEIDPRTIEAAYAMGSSRMQVLFKIKLPLAFNLIMSAIRNMTTMTVALAGIASFVGAGGLGVLIYRGITTNNRDLLLLGSLLIALLAILLDLLLGMIQKRVLSHKKLFSKPVIVFFVALSVLFGSLLISQNQQVKHIKIASKPTTEGYILAEITKQLIEHESDLTVQLTQGVGGGTANLHPATLKGEFDIYPEYSGTSWQIVLKNTQPYNDDLFSELVNQYQQQYQLTWLGLFGFNNTYGLAVHKDLAQQYHLSKFSDLIPIVKSLSFGAEYDFFQREDGFKALTQAYGFEFRQTFDMDNGLKYQALLDKKVDVMTVFTTDGQLANDNLVLLQDDLNFYPTYRAGLVVRMDLINKYPKLTEVLNKLDNLIDESTMAQLNYEVEINGKTPQSIAKKFLIQKGLIDHG